MNKILQMLQGGSLLSDGRASEAADLVLANPRLFSELAEGLSSSEDVIRGRTAHALERISRTRPDLVAPLLGQLMPLALNDKVAMVRWHLAMVFGNLPCHEESNPALPTLFRMLDDRSVFVASWAIVSLAVLGRRSLADRRRIAAKLRPFQRSKSVALRTKAEKALAALDDEAILLPPGWIKSQRITGKSSGGRTVGRSRRWIQGARQEKP